MNYEQQLHKYKFNYSPAKLATHQQPIQLTGKPFNSPANPSTHRQTLHLTGKPWTFVILVINKAGSLSILISILSMARIGYKYTYKYTYKYKNHLQPHLHISVHMYKSSFSPQGDNRNFWTPPQGNNRNFQKIADCPDLFGIIFNIHMYKNIFHPRGDNRNFWKAPPE